MLGLRVRLSLSRYAASGRSRARARAASGVSGRSWARTRPSVADSIDRASARSQRRLRRLSRLIVDWWHPTSAARRTMVQSSERRSCASVMGAEYAPGQAAAQLFRSAERRGFAGTWRKYAVQKRFLSSKKSAAGHGKPLDGRRAPGHTLDMEDETMTTETTDRLATAMQLANRIRDAHRDLRGARVWTGGDHVRVYTGQRDEYLSILPDGTVERSRRNMTWGQLLPDDGDDARTWGLGLETAEPLHCGAYRPC